MAYSLLKRTGQIRTADKEEVKHIATLLARQAVIGRQSDLCSLQSRPLISVQHLELALVDRLPVILQDAAGIR